MKNHYLQDITFQDSVFVEEISKMNVKCKVTDKLRLCCMTHEIAAMIFYLNALRS